MSFLQQHMPDLSGERTVKQFPRGYSNLTYWLQVGEREMVLRRPPFGANIKTAHDVGREYRVLSALHPIYPKAPRPLLYCADEGVIGAPFYVMERIKGVILRPPMPATITPQQTQAICNALVDSLAELHRVDFQKAGLAEFGKPEGYTRRQVEGWIKRYQDARTEALPGIEAAMSWLAGNIPDESMIPPATLIHNDFKHDNLILDPGQPDRVLAVLDWEMATIGNPWMDLGTTLAYWAEPGDPDVLVNFSVTAAPGSLTRDQVAARYIERTGREIPNLRFYYVFGVFKVTVIVQQIYARYLRGATQDERFGRLIELIRANNEMVRQALA
jgi:aminoglycoside phosphotransferase (APT) family kinase protein